MVSVQRQRSPPLAPESQSACRFSTPTPKARDQHKQTLAMRAPAPRILGLDFINWAMSMAAACDSAADLPRVTRGTRSSPLRRKKSAVLYASNYSLAAFRCSRNLTAAIAIAMAHDRSRPSLDGTSTPSRPPFIPSVSRKLAWSIATSGGG